MNEASQLKKIKKEDMCTTNLRMHDLWKIIQLFFQKKQLSKKVVCPPPQKNFRYKTKLLFEFFSKFSFCIHCQSVYLVYHTKLNNNREHNHIKLWWKPSYWFDSSRNILICLKTFLRVDAFLYLSRRVLFHILALNISPFFTIGPRQLGLVCLIFNLAQDLMNCKHLV
jgi:hypothetical protein